MFGKVTARTWLSRALGAHCHNALLKDEESARDNHVLERLVTKYSPIFIFFTGRLTQQSAINLPEFGYPATP